MKQPCDFSKLSSVSRITIFFLFILLTSCGGGNNSSNGLPSNPENEIDTPDPTPTYNITLRWNAPSERQNGEAIYLWELSGYEIRYSKNDGVAPPTMVSIDSAETLEQTIPGLDEDVYEFFIAAIDGENRVSVQSEALIIDLTN